MKQLVIIQARANYFHEEIQKNFEFLRELFKETLSQICMNKKTNSYELKSFIGGSLLDKQNQIIYFLCAQFEICQQFFKTMPHQIETKCRRYRKITYQERQQLIVMVVEEKRKIADAARRLNINPSTARIIIQNFKEEGRIYEKRSDRMQRRQTEAQQQEQIVEFLPTEKPQQNELNLIPTIAMLNAPPVYQTPFPICFQWYPSPFF